MKYFHLSCSHLDSPTLFALLVIQSADQVVSMLVTAIACQRDSHH